MITDEHKTPRVEKRTQADRLCYLASFVYDAHIEGAAKEGCLSETEACGCNHRPRSHLSLECSQAGTLSAHGLQRVLVQIWMHLLSRAQTKHANAHLLRTQTDTVCWDEVEEGVGAGETGGVWVRISQNASA